MISALIIDINTPEGENQSQFHVKLLFIFIALVRTIWRKVLISRFKILLY